MAEAAYGLSGAFWNCLYSNSWKQILARHREEMEVEV